MEWRRKASECYSSLSRSADKQRERQVFHATFPRQRSRWQGQRRTELSVRVQRFAPLAPPWLTLELASASTNGHTHTCTNTQLSTRHEGALTYMHAQLQRQTSKFANKHTWIFLTAFKLTIQYNMHTQNCTSTLLQLLRMTSIVREILIIMKNRKILATSITFPITYVKPYTY